MNVNQIVIAGLLTASCGGSVTAQRQPTPASGPTPVPAQAALSDQSGQRVNADAAVLTDFKARVDKYMTVRKQAAKEVPPLKETDDAAKIKGAKDALATRIIKLNAAAKHGDIFTTAIVAKFRSLLYPELKGDDGRDAKAVLKDDAPTTAEVPFKVNAKYPDNVPVPTVPANLLIRLPTLPEPLRYRIIGNHLLLVDEDAEVIVDYALNVIR
jgi:hypothetical protein